MRPQPHIDSEYKTIRRNAIETFNDPLPEFDGFKPVIGLWMAGGACCGMGIREDKSAITGNLSRFKPHFIRPGA